MTTRREDAAEEQFQQRLRVSERRRSATNDHLIAWAQLQQASEDDVVQRMRAFLRCHQRLVRESERLLGDSVDLTLTLMPAPVVDEADAFGWARGAIGTVAAGTGVATVVSEATERYGTAGTGTPINELHGAAKDRASRALWGGGSVDSGGGGMATGDVARTTAIVGVSALAAGAAAKLAGSRAQTRAQQYEVGRAVDRSNLDVEDEHLRAVSERVEEVSDVLEKLRTRAVAALDKLESVAFEPARHTPLLQTTQTLVKAVQDAASARLISSDGALTDASAALRERHRAPGHSTRATATPPPIVEDTDD